MGYASSWPSPPSITTGIGENVSYVPSYWIDAIHTKISASPNSIDSELLLGPTIAAVLDSAPCGA